MVRAGEERKLAGKKQILKQPTAEVCRVEWLQYWTWNQEVVGWNLGPGNKGGGGGGGGGESHKTHIELTSTWSRFRIEVIPKSHPMWRRPTFTDAAHR